MRGLLVLDKYYIRMVVRTAWIPLTPTVGELRRAADQTTGRSNCSLRLMTDALLLAGGGSGEENQQR